MQSPKIHSGVFLLVLALATATQAATVIEYKLQRWNTGTGADQRLYALIIVDEPWTWREAQDTATLISAQLATTPSTDSLAFCIQLSTKSGAFQCAGPWIGGYRFAGQPWRWTSGVEFVPFAWSPGRPIQSSFLDAAICLGGVDEPDGTWIDALPGPDAGAVSRSAIVVWNKPLDCNTNNIPDPLEILMNPMLDGNGDGRIDVCPPPPPPINPDLNGDGFVNGADLTILLTNFNGLGPTGDVNHDGVVDGQDLTHILSSWGTTGGDP